MKLKKILIAVGAVATVAAVSVGITLAYLTDTSDKVTNVFTVGRVGITLDETVLDGNYKLTDVRNSEGNSYKLIPGKEYIKDPRVTVNNGSEDCWLFVKIEENNDAGKYIIYSVDSTIWTQLTDKSGNAVPGVYYYKEGTDDTAEANYCYDVLMDNSIVINSETVDSAYVATVTEENQPSISITAYAVQKETISDAYEAWLKL